MEADFVIVGLPASGKTTFLAALWHLVESEEAECRLALDSYEGELAHLNRIAEAWRNFQKVPRTSQVGDVDVAIRLVDRETGVKATATFPDLAGETFDAQVEVRRCRPEFIEDVAEGDGILLFISADVKGEALSVVELNAMMPPSAVENAEPLDADAQDGQPPAIEWEPKMVPAQVRVVQLLSDLLRSPFEPRRRRLALMISAWDLVRGMGLSPRGWLAAQMPLVDQFLRTNRDSFDLEVYGVSAQGLSLDDGAAIDQATLLEPSRRILIVGPQGESHDLTSPLVWMMSEK